MKNKNDAKILALKTKIEEKKKLLKVKIKLAKTNCVIALDGINYNLNVTDSQTLLYLMARLTILKETCAKFSHLKDNTLRFSGYSIDNWLYDISNKLDSLSNKEETSNLHVIEEKLTKLLSDDAKIESEIDNIDALLK